MKMLPVDMLDDGDMPTGTESDDDQAESETSWELEYNACQPYAGANDGAFRPGTWKDVPSRPPPLNVPPDCLHLRSPAFAAVLANSVQDVAWGAVAA